MIRIGVIGCGYWGPNLVRNFFTIPDCEMVSVSDLRKERIDYIRKLYPNLRVTPNASGILHDPTIDAIAIITPVTTHFEIARDALVSGKHVLVAKPITRTVSQAEELLRLARENQRVLMVDHTFVYSGPVRKIQTLINQRELGKIYYYDSVRMNLGLFQPDVNVFWDLASHDLSIILYLIDKEPESISAIGAQPVKYNKKGLESLGYLTIRFSDETIAHIHVSWLSPVKIRRTIIGGSSKMIVYDHLDPDNQLKVFDKGVEIQSTDEEYKALVQYRMGDMYAPKVDQTEALEIECKHFINCIQRKGKPITDGYSGLRVLRLLEAADHSLKRNGEQILLKS